jgi:hypothetical protein
VLESAVTMRHAFASIALASALLVPQLAAAQAGEEETVATEEPDATRLDVERLPPEAIHITRQLYAHGFFVEAQLGALGLVNGVGDYVNVGPWASIGVGYEIFDFLHVILSAEGSMHETSAPPPPAKTVFELVGGTASVRLQANFTEWFAMWLTGQFGLLVATTDILGLYGFQSASTIGMTYGGELGMDFHFRSRHHSIGLLGGVRHYPSLEAPGGSAPALGIHGSAYLRYVF